MNIKLDWYDKLVDFSKQKIRFVFWFFICSVVLLFSPDESLKLIYLDVVVSTIGPVIGFIFLGSGILLLINLFIYGKNKFIKSKDVKSKKKLLKDLTELYEIETVTSGFKSQQDCIKWSNSVAPLLKFNEQYYANFMTSSHTINNEGIRGDLPASLFNTMKSQVEMAIAELADIPVDKLSSGQRRRVALSRLLITPARLWILDEPFTALDEMGKQLVNKMLKTHVQEQGMNIIVAHEHVDIPERQLARIQL